MKRHLWHLFAVTTLSACIWSGQAFSQENMKVVVLTGGHGFEEKPFYDMFKEFKNLDCTFVTLKDDSEIFEEVANWPYQVIAMYNMSQNISEKRRQNFVGLLEKGVGLVVLHHAIAAFSHWPEYRKIIGAKYWLEEAVEGGITHPKSQWEEGVNMNLHVEDSSHPVMVGIQDFVLHDETYKGYDLEPDNHLLLSCDAPGSQREVGWTRAYRGAKVCLIQPGHGARAYENPQFRQMLLQAIRWTGEIGNSPR